MQVEINKQEAWKLMDAVSSYLKDYTLTDQTNKTFDAITKKLKKVIKE
jgi:selenophosphate synthase